MFGTSARDEKLHLESTWKGYRNRESGLPSVWRPRCKYPPVSGLVLLSDALHMALYIV